MRKIPNLKDELEEPAAEGAGEHAIMKQTGHKRVDTLRRYIREGDLFRNNPLTKMDL